MEEMQVPQRSSGKGLMLPSPRDFLVHEEGISAVVQRDEWLCQPWEGSLGSQGGPRCTNHFAEGLIGPRVCNMLSGLGEMEKVGGVLNT